MIPRINTVISYCSLDRATINQVIDNALVFSDQVVLVYGDKFLDGITSDNEARMFADYQANTKGIKTHCVTVDLSKGDARFHHNLFREVGYLMLGCVRDQYVLFLDADEIVESGPFLQFLRTTPDIVNFDAFSFDCYWYFRKPIFRAIQTEQAGVAYKASVLAADLSGVTNYGILSHKQERWAFRDIPQLSVKEHIRYPWGPPFAVEYRPFCHHFSWVRTKEQMIAKVKSWGHQSDRDWIPAIEEEFSRPFNGTDFIHNYQYTEVLNTFNIQL